MNTEKRTTITIKTTVNTPIEKIWETWTQPEHIVKWNQASEEWHSPRAENDLRPGGKFTSRMEAKDGSMGFDFGGIYDKVEIHRLITYTMDDGRKVEITFNSSGDKTEIIEIFEAESQNPEEMQRTGWQSILDNFKKYTESL